VVTARPAVGDVWAILEQIADPELPAVSIVDLGIVRDVAWTGDSNAAALRVAITPTYSGCPAMRAIEREIVDRLAAHGIDRVVLEVWLAPAWTTDWMTAAGREKLRAYGISPPGSRAAATAGSIDLVSVPDERAHCPRCGSTTAELISRFGSTACKALYRCTVCREPFDHFKRH